MRVLVTGATGLLGSNVCTQLTAQGHEARAIARSPDTADCEALRKAGVEVVPGDLQDLDSLHQATRGVDAVVHSGAMLGRPGSSMDEGFKTNVIGSINVLSAAAAAGGVPVVQVLTGTFFSTDDGTNERSPLDLLFINKDPYSVTKRLAYVEGVARVESGQDIRFMNPGAIYGPTICLEKGLGPDNFNDRIQRSIRGEMPAQLAMPTPWVTAGDCAAICIAAIVKGVAGERYLGYGVPGRSATIAQVGNMACEMAGVAHRVEEIPDDQLDDPKLVERFGPTMVALARNASMNKQEIDTSFTQQRLGLKPTPLEQGLRETIDWMRANGAI